MSTDTGLEAASRTLTGKPVLPGPGTVRGHGASRQQPVAATPRPRRLRKVVRAAVSAALVAAAFGFALPHLASYHSVWASIAAMTWPQALLVAAVAAASTVSYWIMICSVLPSLRLREAAVVNLGSNAVASTLPALLPASQQDVGECYP
jgi:hypothetical protein